MPKFALDTRLDLKEGLQRLGVSKAFVPTPFTVDRPFLWAIRF
jgi:serine protease inhibitor